MHRFTVFVARFTAIASCLLGTIVLFSPAPAHAQTWEWVTPTSPRQGFLEIRDTNLGFFATGENDDGMLHQSIDGATWTSRRVAHGRQARCTGAVDAWGKVYAIMYEDGETFVASTSDGIVWSEVWRHPFGKGTLPQAGSVVQGWEDWGRVNQINHLAFDGTHLYVAGNRYASFEGMTGMRSVGWLARLDASGTATLLDAGQEDSPVLSELLAKSGVLLGRAYNHQSYPNIQLLRSVDGVVWAPVASHSVITQDQGLFWGASYSGSTFTASTSPDGVTWTEVHSMQPEVGGTIPTITPQHYDRLLVKNGRVLYVLAWPLETHLVIERTPDGAWTQSQIDGPGPAVVWLWNYALGSDRAIYAATTDGRHTAVDPGTWTQSGMETPSSVFPSIQGDDGSLWALTESAQANAYRLPPRGSLPLSGNLITRRFSRYSSGSQQEASFLEQEAAYTRTGTSPNLKFQLDLPACLTRTATGYAAVGDKQLYLSVNGMEWTSLPTSFPTQFRGYTFRENRNGVRLGVLASQTGEKLVSFSPTGSSSSLTPSSVLLESARSETQSTWQAVQYPAVPYGSDRPTLRFSLAGMSLYCLSVTKTRDPFTGETFQTVVKSYRLNPDLVSTGDPWDLEAEFNISPTYELNTAVRLGLSWVVESAGAADYIFDPESRAASYTRYPTVLEFRVTSGLEPTWSEVLKLAPENEISRMLRVGSQVILVAENPTDVSWIRTPEGRWQPWSAPTGDYIFDYNTDTDYLVAFGTNGSRVRSPKAVLEERWNSHCPWGWSYFRDSDWVFSLTHGWWHFPQSDVRTAQWSFNQSLGWVYTGAAIYPWMYVPSSAYGTGKWLRYGFGRVGDGRWFYVQGEGWKSGP